MALEGDLYNRKGTFKAAEFSLSRFDRIYEIFLSFNNGSPTPSYLESNLTLMSSIKDIRRSIDSLDLNPQPAKKTANISFFIELENYAKYLGVSSLGYTHVPRDLIFKDLAIQHQNAVVFTSEMGKNRFDKVPSHETGTMIQTYNNLGRISIKIAQFLRENGYSAHPEHPLMGQVSYPPLAQKASLGWQGKHRLLITPESGSRVILSVVYMSIENLPKPPKNQHRWIENYCENCKLCIKKCPTGAISDSSVNHKNGIMAAMDPGKCMSIFSEKQDCSRCIKECPFSVEDYQKLKRAYINN